MDENPECHSAYRICYLWKRHAGTRYTVNYADKILLFKLTNTQIYGIINYIKHIILLNFKERSVSNKICEAAATDQEILKKRGMDNK